MNVSIRWSALLFGQFLLVFCVVVLSGPGRIDIVDGQTRYEVARSIVDHGDLIIRDPNVWFGVLPGRGGKNYTPYRFPQTLAAVPAIMLADITGPRSEARRHFFFTLIGAAACALLAITYTLWFRHLGLSPLAALSWATAGIFCTPSWFFGTSTFDDILVAAALVAAVAIAHMTREKKPLLGAACSGLLMGLAFNCKQPFGVFVLAALAANYNLQMPIRRQLGRMGLILGGLAIGYLAYRAYEWYKFPPGTTAGHAELTRLYPPTWSQNPLAALACLAISPGTGVFWYCPPFIVSLFGLAAWWRRERWFCAAVVLSTIAVVGFISFLVVFKGDPTWGPRYFTPIFALFWIFAPAATVRKKGSGTFCAQHPSGRPRQNVPDPFFRAHRRFVFLLLGLGLLVQLLALSVDPHRLYIERRLPSVFYQKKWVWLYFDPAISHLLNRPREILDILQTGSQRAERFTPSPSPTFAFPVINKPYLPVTGREAIRKYHVLNSFRPWWISQWYLPPAERPVALLPTFVLLAAVAGLGLLIMIAVLCSEGAATAQPRATPWDRVCRMNSAMNGNAVNDSG